MLSVKYQTILQYIAFVAYLQHIKLMMNSIQIKVCSTELWSILAVINLQDSNVDPMSTLTI